MAVDIAHKVEPFAGGGKGIERDGGHLRPQVRATNSNIDHIRDGGVRPHLLCVGQHGDQRGMHLGLLHCYGFSSCLRFIGVRCGRISQQDMPHRTLLGAVDLVARKHGVAMLLHAALPCQVQQQRFAGGVDTVLGQVRKHQGGGLAEALEPLGVLCKSLAQIQVFANRCEIVLQLPPGGSAVTTCACHGVPWSNGSGNKQ